MKVTIFTDESGVKLPKMNKWKKSYSKGKDIDKCKEILSLLHENNLPLPEYNIELEDMYREILHEYIRPAKAMFAGMFVEVRNFKDQLSESSEVSLNIISGRYGLLEENDSIVPYVSNIKLNSDVEKLDNRTAFSQKMIEKAINSDIVLIFLPASFVSYLVSIKWFGSLDTISRVVLVTCKHFKDHFSHMYNVTILDRKGVARIGLVNREKIVSIINF